MKVVLIRYYDHARENTRLPSSLNKVQGILPPQGLAYIAAVLKKNNIPVRIIDCPGSNISVEDFKKLLKKLKPDIAGIGPVMTPALEGIYECAKICKEHGCTTVLGGAHMSIYPKETLSFDFVDFGIIGEGDFVFLDLVRALENKEDYSKIKGVIYKKNGTVHVNTPSLVNDLDTLPMPAYEMLPMKKYNSIIGVGKASTIMATRGCPFRCGFCYKTPSDSKHRKRNPKKVVKEMEFLISKYNIDELMFYDDTLTVDRNFTVELCSEIKKSKKKIRWESPTRVDRLDKELLKIMKDSGCIRLRMGVESGNEKILKHMNKGITKEQARQVFNWCKSLGIETFAYFIIGYHGENEKTMQETIDFACELNPGHVMFTVGTPLPETPFWTYCVDDNLVHKEYWRDYTLGKKHERIPYIVEGADKWVKKAYRQFYFRKQYIIQRIKKINSIDNIKKGAQGAIAILRL